MLIVPDEQEEASTLDALEKHMYAKGWKTNFEKIQKSSTPVSFYGSSTPRHVKIPLSKSYKQVIVPNICHQKENTFGFWSQPIPYLSRLLKTF